METTCQPSDVPLDNTCHQHLPISLRTRQLPWPRALRHSSSVHAGVQVVLEKLVKKLWVTPCFTSHHAHCHAVRPQVRGTVTTQSIGASLVGLESSQSPSLKHSCSRKAATGSDKASSPPPSPALNPSCWPAMGRGDLTRQSTWYLKNILWASKNDALQNKRATVEGLALNKKKKKASSHTQSWVSYKERVVWTNPPRMFAPPSCAEGLREQTEQLCCGTSAISLLGLQSPQEQLPPGLDRSLFWALFRQNRFHYTEKRQTFH